MVIAKQLNELPDAEAGKASKSTNEKGFDSLRKMTGKIVPYCRLNFLREAFKR